MKSVSKTFWARYRGLVGPEHAGAEYPPFDPLGFNESRFDRELRAKRVSVDFEDGRPVVSWTSEGWPEERDGEALARLAKEVWRCLAACGLAGPASLSVRSRHGGLPAEMETDDVRRAAKAAERTIGA